MKKTKLMMIISIIQIWTLFASQSLNQDPTTINFDDLIKQGISSDYLKCLGVKKSNISEIICFTNNNNQSYVYQISRKDGVKINFNFNPTKHDQHREVRLVLPLNFQAPQKKTKTLSKKEKIFHSYDAYIAMLENGIPRNYLKRRGITPFNIIQHGKTDCANAESHVITLNNGKKFDINGNQVWKERIIRNICVGAGITAVILGILYMRSSNKSKIKLNSLTG